MSMLAPVPESVRKRIRDNTHPGLRLDKYVESYASAESTGKFSEHVQKPAIEAVAGMSPPPGFDFRRLLDRRREMYRALAAVTFHARTAGPLTLHLARPSVLENAGICLHPIYGFVRFPGSGLKGMARSFAETVWLPVQNDPKRAWREIEDVFGWADTPERRERIKSAHHPAAARREVPDDVTSTEIKSSQGVVIFHDAWPTAWPRLIVDIVNNHHHDYYAGQGGDPPGDWESPVPIYFLAVPPGETFEFALGLRAGSAAELLERAREWLVGALIYQGAGAKTAAGYGAFQVIADSVDAGPVTKAGVAWQSALKRGDREEFCATVNLVTPAFLCGATHRRAEDCQLRPATVRGLLRWWWRTLHVGYIDSKTLFLLEAALWGDTRSGGAIRIEIEPKGNLATTLYSKPEHADITAPNKDSPYGIPGCKPDKTTQGLWYLSFGMDERSHGERQQRYCVEPGACWTIRLRSRSSYYFADRTPPKDPTKRRPGKWISAAQVCRQAQAALWLLCSYGGVGSKCRKGFGSLALDDLGEWNLESCIAAGASLRDDLGLAGPFQLGHAQSPSLSTMLAPVSVDFSWTDVWQVLDQVGFAYQSFAKGYRHRREKKALGLPRKEDRPTGVFHPIGPVNRIIDEARKKGKEHDVRHAAPIQVHLAPTLRGGYQVRLVAFPAAFLPELAVSRDFLQKFLDHMHGDLCRRAALSQPAASRHAGGRTQQRAVSPPKGKRDAGTRVRVTILAERKPTPGHFDVQERGKPPGTLTVGTPPTPLPDLGSEIEVEVHNDDPRRPQYRWPRPPEAGPPPGRSGRRPRVR